MFNYKIAVTLAGRARPAMASIRTNEDVDIKDVPAMLGFLLTHGVPSSMGRIFGAHNVENCEVVEKTLLISQA
jgi:hypothetical protein